MTHQEQQKTCYLVDDHKWKSIGLLHHQKIGQIPEGFFTLEDHDGHPCATFYTRTKLMLSVSIKNFERDDQPLKKQNFKCFLNLISGKPAELHLSYTHQDGSIEERQEPISTLFAQELLDICDDRLLERDVYVRDYAETSWTVHDYKGRLSGLKLAIADFTEGKPAICPPWGFKDVSNDPAYTEKSLYSAVPKDLYKPKISRNRARFLSHNLK